MSQLAPRAWHAMCDLIGGPERVASEPKWGDGFALNLGQPGSKLQSKCEKILEFSIEKAEVMGNCP